jgi:hypothetical protein
MNRIQRCLAVLAGFGGTMIALAAAAPAAFAYRLPPGPTPPGAGPPAWIRHPHLPPGHIHQPVHQVLVPVPSAAIVSGGLPGWQVTLIAAVAAVLTAALAVLLHRAWAARRRATTSAT